MQGVQPGIDRAAAAIGNAFARCSVGLALAVAYGALACDRFRTPTTWGSDAASILYGAPRPAWI